MKYFITGGAGFIGSCLTNKLLKQNHRVTVYDNFSLGKKKFLSKNKYLKIISGDILNEKLLQKSMKDHDFIYHLAANSDIPAGINNPKLDFNVNTIGTLNVLNSMICNKIKQIVFASSSAVFGIPTVFPTPETYGPCLPESFYGASKLAAEGFISSYCSIYGIKAWIFRFANITGSPATHGIIFDFMKKVNNKSKTFSVLGNGTQQKSYITNEILVDGIFSVINKTKNKNQKILLYNIGNEDFIKISKIAKIFIKSQNSKKILTYGKTKGGWKGDVPQMRLDITRIKKLGWEPTLSSEESIKSAIDNYSD